MITTYNRLQIIKAVLCLLAAVVCYVLADVFFHFGLTFVFHTFRWSYTAVPWLCGAALIGITWSGWRQWQAGLGFKNYAESPFFHDLNFESGGSLMLNHYAKQVTGPAYVLSQIFLGGPLMTLRAIKHLRERLPNPPGIELRLQEALLTLQRANKWQSIEEHPALKQEILMLAQMRKIDSSSHKGPLRIKASSPHGI
ncbi:hypothetical protein WJU23_14700 [Prosthecobacter sp. SYSU 5D2]|uniref:hypothetical protein n=1 Tax=Prosthecobacter sp. SYSU 5D2 TaxID=3134134 RepID=UPI0031FF187F